MDPSNISGPHHRFASLFLEILFCVYASLFGNQGRQNLLILPISLSHQIKINASILLLQVHISSPDVDQFINLLLTIPAKGYENSFAYVMSEWTKLQGKHFCGLFCLLFPNFYKSLQRNIILNACIVKKFTLQISFEVSDSLLLFNLVMYRLYLWKNRLQESTG